MNFGNGEKMAKQMNTISLFIMMFILSSCGTIYLRSPDEDLLKVKEKYKDSSLGIENINLINLDNEFNRCRFSPERFNPRGGAVKVNDYLKSMLNKKLRENEIYTNAKDKQMSIDVAEFDFNSQIFFGKWYIKSKVKFKGREFEIDKQINFSTNYVGYVACSQVAAQLPIFLNEYLEQIVNNPKIQALLN